MLTESGAFDKLFCFPHLAVKIIAFQGFHTSRTPQNLITRLLVQNGTCFKNKENKKREGEGEYSKTRGT